MYYFVQALIVVFLLSAQTTWLKLFSFNGVTPDLALIWVVYCAVRYSWMGGAGPGLAIGITQDSLSGGLLGVNTFSKTLIGYFFSTLKNKLFIEGVIPMGIFLALASIFDGLVFYFSTMTILKGEVAPSFLYQMLPVYSVYNVLIAPVMFMTLDKINGWLKLHTQP